MPQCVAGYKAFLFPMQAESEQVIKKYQILFGRLAIAQKA
jgi:hypothetical protein